MKEITEKEKFIYYAVRKIVLPMLRQSLINLSVNFSTSEVSYMLRCLLMVLGISGEETSEKIQDIIAEKHHKDYDGKEIYLLCSDMVSLTPTIENCLYRRNIHAFIDASNLTELQEATIQYLVLRYLAPNIITALGTVFLNSSYDFFNCYLKQKFMLPEQVCTWEIYNDLVSLGLLANTNDLAVTGTLSKFVTYLEQDEKTSILDLFIGKPEKSCYELKDFTWIKSLVIKKLLKNATKEKTQGVNILLYGPPGTGKTEFAKSLSEACGIQCYTLPDADEKGFCNVQQQKLKHLKIKETLLSNKGNACILFDEAEDIMTKDYLSKDGIGKNFLNNLLENTKVPIIWTTNTTAVDTAFLRRMTYCMEFKELNTKERKVIWKAELNRQGFKIKDKTLNNLVKSYNVPVSVISNAVKCTKLVNGKEKELKGFIESIGDVAIPDYKIEEEKETKIDYNKEYIKTDLNLPLLTNRLVNVKKMNFSMCLYGVPGTGKSYYARYLAKELKLKVICKKASDLIDSYVGQTEKNIARAFEEAKEEKAMLIFDEADSFLLNRMSAKNSWEVTQVNEMLTQMESAEYPFVCTTNLIDSLDEASLRRFTFKVKFDFMGEKEVEKALRNLFKIQKPINIDKLTIGDCMIVKKKAEFLDVTNEDEIIGMLKEEVKVKQVNERIGF